MGTIINAIREVLGVPTPFISDGVIHYEIIAEYIVSALMLLIVTSWIFKIVYKVFFSK